MPILTIDSGFKGCSLTVSGRGRALIMACFPASHENSLDLCKQRYQEPLSVRDCPLVGRSSLDAWSQAWDLTYSTLHWSFYLPKGVQARVRDLNLASTNVAPCVSMFVCLMLVAGFPISSPSLGCVTSRGGRLPGDGPSLLGPELQWQLRNTERKGPCQTPMSNREGVIWSHAHQKTAWPKISVLDF